MAISSSVNREAESNGSSQLKTDGAWTYRRPTFDDEVRLASCLRTVCLIMLVGKKQQSSTA